jgi:hypothetical protein
MPGMHFCEQVMVYNSVSMLTRALGGSDADEKILRLYIAMNVPANRAIFHTNVVEKEGRGSDPLTCSA